MHRPLFQDKLVRGSKSFSIKVDGTSKDNSAPFKAMTPSSKRGAKPYTSLLDTKGNSYYIPSSSASSLKVHVQDQTSATPSAEASHGYYGTAWLEHGASNNKYEYAVYVKTPSYGLTTGQVWSHQASKLERSKIYKVLKHDGDAHVVKF